MQINLQIATLAAALAVATSVAPSLAAQHATLASGMVTSATSGSMVAAMDFGSPPSGEVPILFNDRHVYAKPDVLRQERVLAALVRGNTILVPLRSMFEQMGATVTYDAGGKTVTAKKSGSTVAVTLGKNEVVINGESRPLDVPPMMYQGTLMVPVRVISEALGAYVQWVPSQRVVVVRYLPPTPVPTAPPTAAPTAPPTPAPTPTPTPVPKIPYLGFADVSYAWGKTYNEFANGANSKGGAYQAHGALLFDPFAVKVDLRQDSYDTTTNCVYNPQFTTAGILPCGIRRAYATGTPLTCFNTIDGGADCTQPFRARQGTVDGRLEFKVFDPHVYIGVGYIGTNNNYGYPQLRGVGFGVEKLPDFNNQQSLNYFASAFYYPNASANYTVNDPTSSNFGKTYKQQYSILKYDVGLTYSFGTSPFYILGGLSGDRYTTKANAPVNQTHNGPYIGLGVHF